MHPNDSQTMSYTSGYQFQSFQGPGDPMLRRSEIEGLMPVSRIGETTLNAFVDGYEFGTNRSYISGGQITGEFTGQLDEEGNAETDKESFGTPAAEHKPMFYEWASVLPGMLCVSRKARNATFRAYTAAETATPVIACCACIPKAEEKNYYFAGICRSKSVRQPDDGRGPTEDEFFTLSIGGLSSILNNSHEPVYPGDLIAWTFYSEKALASDDNNTPNRAMKRSKSDPRRIAIKVATPGSDKLIGKCLSFAKPGEPFECVSFSTNRPASPLLSFALSQPLFREWQSPHQGRLDKK